MSFFQHFCQVNPGIKEDVNEEDNEIVLELFLEPSSLEKDNQSSSLCFNWFSHLNHIHLE
jgi:hypothetical protein